MNKLLSVSSVKTMSSIELVKIINEMRDEGAAELRHNDFTAKVRKVLGDEAAKFSAALKTESGQTAQGYNFPKREAHLMVMSESYKVQAAVYDKMTELEAGSVIQNQEPPKLQNVAKEYKGALALAKLVGYKDNQAHLAANKAVIKNIGFDVHEAMGLSLVSPVQSRLMTPTDIGSHLGMSGIKVNKLLKDRGFQADSRDLKNNIVWTPTDKGLKFAVLLDTNKKSANGTPVQQLKWYESVVEELGV